MTRQKSKQSMAEGLYGKSLNGTNLLWRLKQRGDPKGYSGPASQMKASSRWTHLKCRAKARGPTSLGDRLALQETARGLPFSA